MVFLFIMNSFICAAQRDPKKQKQKQTQWFLLLLFSFLSSHTHGARTQKDKTPACCGPANCFAALCIISLEFELSSSSVAFAVCFFFSHSPPPPRKTHVRDMAANKIRYLLLRTRAHTCTHMLDYKRKNKSTHSFIHSLNQGKQQKPGKQQQQQHAPYILLQERSSSAFATT